ncbi:MAG: tRNA epoxyqueuosine(34) reductase QueG [Pseudomonadota bacterium]
MVPAPALRHGPRHARRPALCGPGLLSGRDQETQQTALKEALFRHARSLGFDTMGVCPPDSIPDAVPRLKQFVHEGHHGSMDWLSDTAERRADPRVLWPDVKSIVMLGMNYGPAHDPLTALSERSRGLVASYALGEDYHEVIKKRLKTLARWLVAETGTELKVFVDTAPVMEKPLAAAAGLGWQGKHTNLVARDHGSWLFLGAIFTALPLLSDAAETDHCGSCRACLDVCPTDAFPAPYRLDARRCLSYLTIENKGAIPAEFRAAMGNRIYGCDDCLAVCPWNKFAARAAEARFAARADIDRVPLLELADMDDAAFRARFRKSPIKRTGRDRFLRNVMVAIGNSGDEDHLPVLKDRVRDEAPLVRGHAAWAMAKIAPNAFLAERDTCLPREHDPGVRAEWQAAESAVLG